MENNNWRAAAPGGSEGGVDSGGDWRAQLQPEARQRIVNKIMDTLKRHLPFSGPEGLQGLQNIAVRFEEKTYSAALSQSDYLRKISLKMLTMESKSQNALPNPANGANPSDPGAASHSMQPQAHNQGGQSLPIPLQANQAQAHQHLLSQNIQNTMASSGVQNSAGLQPAMTSVSGLTQTSIPSASGQNATMQNITGLPQNTVSNSMGQNVPSNMYVNAQRQMPGRQQVVPQQQPQSQNPQLLYHQQMIMKQKLQQGNSPNTLSQSHMQQQQQQQSLLQPNQLQTAQPSGVPTSSVMQPSMMQSAPLSSLQQNQPSSVQQSTQSMLQHQQSVLRKQQQPQQTGAIHQQQTPMMQQPMMATQQQPQQLMGQQTNANNMLQNQLIGQQNSLGDMQQQQQRLLGQQNSLQNLQQQLMVQQNNLSNMHQQQLGSQSNVSGLQQQKQQQILGAQSGNPSMQANQQSVHMMQQPKVQQTQQGVANMLPSQGQQSQPQQSQIQSQAAQLQQQMGLQQQSNPLQRDLQQRFQAPGLAPGSMRQGQNVLDQQKQLYQNQRTIQEGPSTSLDSTAQTGQSNGGNWQEEVYQRLQQLKETYFSDLSEMYQKISAKLQQHDSLPQQPKSEQLEMLKLFKSMLERMMSILQMSKNNIQPGLKEKLGSYEKQIINFLNPNKPRKPIPPLQQGQLAQPHLQSMQQTQSHIPQMQSHDTQMNPQLQTLNMQGSMPGMQQNSVSSLQHNSVSSMSGAPTSHQNMVHQLQSGSNTDSGQGNAINSLRQVTLPQNPATQQPNMNTLSSQSTVNMLQHNVPHQSNPNMLQQQNLKQHQEQQLTQSQQLKQHYQQRQMQQQLMQKIHQQPKQQVPGQMQTHQMQQLHQLNDVNEMKIRQGMGTKPGVFQQHFSTTQRSTYPHQQMKVGASFAISSPQLLQATSPQLSQHSSPQVDQQNLLSTIPKMGTPLQSANSPFVVSSPSTPLAPSPMPGDSEKLVSGVSSISNAQTIGQQTAGVQTQPQSLAIGTPGISASPLLAEFSGPDGAHAGTLTTASGRSSVTEQPLERLIKAVKSLSPDALSASVNDIGSVVSMIDRIAGSAPVNGSRAAVGEDLAAMTTCRLQTRNFISQDGVNGTRKMKRHTSAVPLNVVSSAGSGSDSFKRLIGPETSDLESTATSSVKRPKIEANHALLEEIREINQRLIDTVVDISEEDLDQTAAAAVADGGEGTIVKCSFSAVALCPSLKLQYSSAQMAPIQPLRLLVPTNYPNCSPVLLDKLPIEVSKEYEDLSVKAKSRFSISLRSLSQPMSLAEIARTWDVCAHAVISEHAQQSGGGTFSSKYGNWENCAA